MDRVRGHWPDILRVVASIHTGAVSAHDVIRMLQHGGNPTQLGDAFVHYGRIFKTLHVLSYVDDEAHLPDRIANGAVRAKDAYTRFVPPASWGNIW